MRLLVSADVVFV